MNLKIIEVDNKVIIENVKDFEPKHIFDCGQCFRWNLEKDGSYTGIAFNRVINVKKEGNKIILSNTNIEDYNNIWYDYFDLGRDYGLIKNELSKDEVLKEAIKFGNGIRILKQDIWETLISFIISTNNRIPMIKRAIENLSESYGEYLGEFNGKKMYSFPKPNVLANLNEEDIRLCKTGFRAKYILSAAKKISNDKDYFNRIKKLDTTGLREELKTFKGIGPKVADCIMLFSFSKYDSFPIDVWVKRIMEYFYLDKEFGLKKIQDFGQQKFKDLAGFAQQYLFYYARELGIGK